MRGVTLICILLALPVLAVLGHDVYYAINKSEIGLDNTFQQAQDRFSALGWLWVKYAPQFYDLVRTSVDQDIWIKYVTPVLRQKAILVTAVPALTVYALLGVLKFFGLYPFAGNGIINIARRKKSSYAVDPLSPKGKAMKYRRK